MVELQANMSSPEVQEIDSPKQLSISVCHMYSIIEESDSEASESSMMLSPSPLPDRTKDNQRTVMLIPRVEITKDRDPSPIVQNEIKKYNLRQTNITKMLRNHETNVANQEPRSPMQLTLPYASINADALTPRRALEDMTNRSVDYSTPHRDKETSITKRNFASIKAKAVSSKLSNISQTEESILENSMVNRPRRACRPRSLKEPNCRDKLRSQTQSK